MCSGGSKWQPYSHPSSAWRIPLTKSVGAKIYAWRGLLSGGLLCKIHRCSLDGDLLVRQLKLQCIISLVRLKEDLDIQCMQFPILSK